MKYHTAEKCFANPNSSVYNTERAIAYRAKHPVSSTSSANVRMTRVLPPPEEELRSLTGDHSILNIIYLDGGSDCNILNYHHFHMFTRCESYDCGINGIAGQTDKLITGLGDINFMGVQLPSFYSSSLNSSVVSESLLTFKFGFSVMKYDNVCIITDV